jgi:hypothetical protein
MALRSLLIRESISDIFALRVRSCATVVMVVAGDILKVCMRSSMKFDARGKTTDWKVNSSREGGLITFDCRF